MLCARSRRRRALGFHPFDVSGDNGRQRIPLGFADDKFTPRDFQFCRKLIGFAACCFRCESSKEIHR
ncbi:MAG: hypothetical protein IID44_07185 [Planctomycetes bacterium]|nr:hypothetical protein [Planctomycetota bacterium]